MKYIKKLLPILLMVLGSAGCHSQQPVSTFGIAFNATAPSSCATGCTQANVTPSSTYCATAQTVQGGAFSAPTAVFQIAIPALPLNYRI
jgi:hypothetical protein